MLYYKTLKPHIKKAILNRQYSKEQLQQIHDALERDYRKSRRIMLILAAATIVAFVLLTADGSDELFSILRGVLALAVLFAIVIFVALAVPKIQYKIYVHKAYPEYKDSF
jgi:TRAP-type C4-dicarboxylate transport system permease large subunit